MAEGKSPKPPAIVERRRVSREGATITVVELKMSKSIREAIARQFSRVPDKSVTTR